MGWVGKGDLAVIGGVVRIVAPGIGGGEGFGGDGTGGRAEAVGAVEEAYKFVQASGGGLVAFAFLRGDAGVADRDWEF